VTGISIGYARVATAEQDLTAQRDGLAALGSKPTTSTLTMASPAPAAPGPACAKRSPPSEEATPSDLAPTV